MSQFFISGIGTDVGKTFVTCALLNQEPSYKSIKPILSGYDCVAGSDAGELLQAMDETPSESAAQSISPFRFKAPLSPHFAAAKEGKVIDKEKLLNYCNKSINTKKNLLIEGAGGLMVPITPDWLMIDWMRALGLPVILVGASYLGAINHTLLSLQALEKSELNLHALIISQSENCAGLTDTAQSIAPFMPIGAALISVPRISSWRDAPNLLSLLA
jgi:dethiobiotin synthetase